MTGRAAVTGIVLTIALLLLTSGSSTASQSISYTSTADYDNGVKGDPSDGNYNVETETDNFKHGPGTLTLANKWGDNFNHADADADTWKWTPRWWAGGGTASANISTTSAGELYITQTGTAGLDVFGAISDFNLSGDFDIQVDYSELTIAAVDISAAGFMLSTSQVAPVNYISMVRLYNSAAGGHVYYGATDSDTNTNVAATADVGGSFRVTRAIAGNNVDMKCYYDNAGWVELHSHTYDKTVDTWADDDYHVGLTTYSNTGDPDISLDFDNFRVNSGLNQTGAYRTSGVWDSAPINKLLIESLSIIDITVSGGGDNASIDRVAIVDTISGAEITDYDTNITSDKRLSSSDFDNGTALTSNRVVKIRLYLGGNGSDTITVNDLTINWDPWIAGGDEPFPMDFEYDAEGLMVRFAYIGGNFSSIRWSFGDGIGSDRVNPVHTYQSYGIGQYNVTLEVRDQHGRFHTIQKPVILAKPIVDTEGNALNILPFSWPAYFMIITGTVSVIFNLYRESVAKSAWWQEFHVTVACVSGLWAFLGVVLYIL